MKNAVSGCAMQVFATKASAAQPPSRRPPPPQHQPPAAQNSPEKAHPLPPKGTFPTLTPLLLSTMLSMCFLEGFS